MSKKHCLLCLTGSVASIKVTELVQSLVGANLDVQVAATNSAIHFIKTMCPTTKNVSAAGLPIPPPGWPSAVTWPPYTDADEWQAWCKRGDPVRHIQLSQWADIVVVAPMDANTLAKLTHGICDNLVSCVLRAWGGCEDGTISHRKPMVLAPAMNTAMWEHPLTQTQLSTIKKFPWPMHVVPPVSKVLMCGVSGIGAMATVEDISKEVSSALASSPKGQGVKKHRGKAKIKTVSKTSVIRVESKLQSERNTQGQKHVKKKVLK